jgi:hypothetical protein
MQVTLRALILLACLAELAGCGGGGGHGDAGSSTTTAGSNSVTATQAPPAPPATLTATAGNALVALSWTGSSGATSYHVKRATSSGGPFAQIATATSPTYTDSTVSNATAYWYVVAAANAVGESADSGDATATPEAPAVIPAAPTQLTATAGDAQVSLIWSSSSGSSGYLISRSTTSGGPYTSIASPTTTSYVDTPVTDGTTYYYVVAAFDAAGVSPNSMQVSATPAAPVTPVTPVTPAAGGVSVTVNPASTHPISPYIYGVNGANSTSTFPPGTGSARPANLTFDRSGGNRLTAYNWETNASNAGSDYLYENDAFLSGSKVPAAVVTEFVAADQSAGLASLITFQMQGLVAADEDAADTMNMSNPPVSDANRFDKVVYKKSTVSSVPFTATPDLTDGYVFMDEMIWNVDRYFSGQNIFGSNPATQRVFAQLDNEPDLWNSTHKEIQGATNITPSAFVTKSINLAEALKAQFPSLVVFGAVNYGFLGIYSWQGAIANATPSGNDWFADQYLTAMHSAAASFGKPVVDVYDFHWYSSASDDNGGAITDLNGATLTAAQVQAIVQSPRSLWDKTYAENSWIAQNLGGPIYILGRLQAKIAAENPGMKLSISEYNNGGAQHIAGTIAEADNLGVFGAQNLFAANLWPLVTSEPYILAGFRAFRDFDGAGSNFGDTSVQATSSNVGNVAVYVSTDSTRPGRVVMVAINRSTASQATTIAGQPLSGTAHLYRMSAATASSQTTVQPVAAGTQSVSGSSITLTLPAMSVTTIDIH